MSRRRDGPALRLPRPPISRLPDARTGPRTASSTRSSPSASPTATRRNDPDFTEPWYEGANELPASRQDQRRVLPPGRGLVRRRRPGAAAPTAPTASPTTTRFYGGDIAGIRQKLDYLNDLGVTVIYFNPLNQGMSNHKYDPVDYLTIDPHFADARGVQGLRPGLPRPRHPHRGRHGLQPHRQLALRLPRRGARRAAAVQYWNWYEFEALAAARRPRLQRQRLLRLLVGLRAAPEPELRPDARQRRREQHRRTSRDADAQHGRGRLRADDGRRTGWASSTSTASAWTCPTRCRSGSGSCSASAATRSSRTCWLVGELWGNAGRWIGPHCFDSTMNYKFFRDPVMDFFGKGRIDAATFDAAPEPGPLPVPAPVGAR